MAMISALPVLGSPDGSETVVVLKNGRTMRAVLTGLATAAIAGSVAIARGFALSAEDKANLANLRALSAQQAANDSGTYLAGVREAVTGLPSGTRLPLEATSRAIMAGFTAQTAGRLAILSEEGRGGHWEWLTGNRSALVTSDPDQALYVAPIATPNGSAGVWRRLFTSGIVFASWAGVIAGSNAASDPAINRLISFPNVSAVMLPIGVTTINGPLNAGSGKSIVGQGQGLSTLKALPTFKPSNDAAHPNGNSMLYGMPGAVGVRFADMTVDGSKVGNHYLNGVNMFANRGFVVERLTLKDISGYANWAVGWVGSHPDRLKLDVCSGVFRDVWVYNANVHFEATAANNVLFERCHARDGDGDIGCEAWFHPYSSKNITYRDCSGYGRTAAGTLIANYEPGTLTENITFDNVSMEVLGGGASMAIICFTGAMKNIRIANSRIISEGYIGAYTGLQGGTAMEKVVFENTTVDGLQEGLTIGFGTEVAVRGGYYRARSAGPTANNYPLLYGAGAKIVIDGPELDGDGAALASFPSSVDVTVVAQPNIGDKVPVVPIGRGHKITRSLNEDQIINGVAAPIGESPAANLGNQFNLNGIGKGPYRVLVSGTYRTDTANTGISLNINSYGSRRAVGFIEASRTAYDAAPVRGAFGVDGASVFAVPDALNTSRQFCSEFLYYAMEDQTGGLSIGAGPYNAAFGVGPENGNLVVEAGTTLTMERL